MYNNKKIMVLITARGGSKGLPGKNKKKLAGKPLIAWSVKQALSSKYVDYVMVSTDDEQIASIAAKYGANIPFIRPSELATSSAKSIDVVLHAIENIEKNGKIFDILVLLQPTSPLRTTKDIDNAIELLFSSKGNSVISVCESEHHPWWSNTLPKNGKMDKFINKKYINANRQQLPICYRINGAIYVAFLNYLKKQKTFLGKNTFAYKMPIERSVDIDTILDFKLAEILKCERK